MSNCMSRDRYLRDYVLDIENEFVYDGNAASWAPSTNGGALFWGNETSSLDLVQDDPPNDEAALPSACMAITPDHRFLAVATNSAIRIYTAATKTLVANLAAQQEGVGQLVFLPGRHDGSQYTLISGGLHRGGKDAIIAWQLDARGKPLSRVMPFAVDNLADKAVAAIEADLLAHHELSREALQDLSMDIMAALNKADTTNRRRDLAQWEGQLPNFDPVIFRPDGSAWFYLSHNETTQHGMRPADELPQIAVLNGTDQHSPEIRLCGHEDAIMWAAWSPTDPNIIASAAWDGQFRIWDSTTGLPKHIIRPTGRQNWSGAFSPDGKYILFAGTNHVGIYLVSSGELFLKLERPNLAAWVRYLSWCPDGKSIALASGTSVILWEPFDEGGKQTELFKLAKSEKPLMEGFKTINFVKWLNGNKLVVGTSEDSWCVWDKEKNWKWRFQRPQGRVLDLWECDCLMVGKKLMCLDGDWKVREWKLV